jgi:tetratricopeptide (TPR) repeat protein
VLAELGQFGQAAARGGEALGAAEGSDNPFAFAAASVGLGLVYVRKAEPRSAIPPLERALALCRAYDLGNWIATVAACLGAAYVRVGRVDAAISLLEEAVSQGARTGIIASHSLWLVCLGEAYFAAGRTEDADATARRALELCRTSGAHGDEGWAMLLLGEIAAATAREAGAAQARYQDALAIAQKLEMRPLEARCHLALGRLLVRGGEHASGEGHLARAAVISRELSMPLDAEPARR